MIRTDDDLRIAHECIEKIERTLIESRRKLTPKSGAAKPAGGLDKITSTLALVKSALGVDPERDWLEG